MLPKKTALDPSRNDLGVRDPLTQKDLLDDKRKLTAQGVPPERIRSLRDSFKPTFAERKAAARITQLAIQAQLGSPDVQEDAWQKLKALGFTREDLPDFLSPNLNDTFLPEVTLHRRSKEK